jgi:hypothetical protein
MSTRYHTNQLRQWGDRTHAHVKEERQADGRIILKNRRSNGKQIVFNDDVCKAIRKNLHRHSKHLDGNQNTLSL